MQLSRKLQHCEPQWAVCATTTAARPTVPLVLPTARMLLLLPLLLLLFFFLYVLGMCVKSSRRAVLWPYHARKLPICNAASYRYFPGSQERCLSPWEGIFSLRSLFSFSKVNWRRELGKDKAKISSGEKQCKSLLKKCKSSSKREREVEKMQRSLAGAVI